MKILLDECLPKDLKKEFPDHEIITVREMKWNGKKNGELFALMVKSKFKVFITIDANLIYQQNFTKHSIIIVNIKASSNDIEILIPIARRINRRLKSLQHGRVYQFE